MIRSQSPFTEIVLKHYPFISEKDALSILTKLDDGFQLWSGLDVTERQRVIDQIGRELEANADVSAELISLEMGKPIIQAQAEIRKCIDVCTFYSDMDLTDAFVESIREGVECHYQPTGTILGIMPWNYPFWQVFRFAIPTLLAGNAVLLKHAPNVPQCALMIEKIIHQVCLDPFIFASVFADNDLVETLISDRRLTGVSLTGSVQAGKAVGSVALNHLKPVVLELGGNDPFVVLDDVNVDEVVKMAVQGRNQNSGQTCIAAKRFLIHETIFDAFKETYLSELNKYVLGDPLKKETTMGPLARIDLADKVRSQVKANIDAGSKWIPSALSIPDKGYFVQPAVLCHEEDDVPALHDEIFGPIANFWRISNVDDAISKANMSYFGLGASIWTSDRKKAKLFLEEVQSGVVALNALVSSQFDVPFGGTKESGMGRELACDGLRAFTNKKSILT